jgi:FLYWCH zinc finger domain
LRNKRFYTKICRFFNASKRTTGVFENIFRLTPKFSIPDYNAVAVFTLSQRGKRMLIHNGFTYTLEREAKDSHFWKCSLFRRLMCKARAITKNFDGQELVRLTHRLHTHEAKRLKDQTYEDKEMPKGQVTEFLDISDPMFIN